MRHVVTGFSVMGSITVCEARSATSGGPPKSHSSVVTQRAFRRERFPRLAVEL